MLNKKTSSRLLIAAIAAVTSLAPLAAPAIAQQDKMKTVAVIASTSYDELLTDIDYLGEFGGQVQAGQSLNNMLLMFTQNKGLQGVDQTKSWGAMVETDGFQFIPVVCLPVTDLDAVLATIANFGMTTSEVGDGIMEIEMPNQSLFVKKDGNWAYLSQQAEYLSTTPADPGATFSKMTEEYDLCARVMVQNIPEMYRSLAVNELRKGAEQGLERNEGESDEAFEARKKMTMANVEQLAKSLAEFDEVTVGFNTDTDAGNVILDFTYSALPNTQLAKSIEIYKDTKTDYAGCMKEGAAMMFNLTATTPQELLSQYRDQMQGQWDSLRQQMMNAIDQEDDIPNEEAREVIKDAAGDLMDAVEATAMSGKFDSAGYIDVQNGEMDGVAGGYLKDTTKVESALKKLEALVENDPNFPGVDWNAESYGGTAIHTLSVPVPEDEDDARKLFGETIDVAVALGDEVAYVAVGSNYMATLKSAIDGSGSSSASVKPVQFSLALTPIMMLAAETEPNPAVDAMLDALVTKSNGEDQVHLTMDEANDAVRVRFELEKGVLEAIGAAARQAQRQGAAAGF